MDDAKREPFDDPMAQMMAHSVHDSTVHPMLAMDDAEEPHASSRGHKRASDDHKHKRHKHKHHKHKDEDKHRKKKKEKQKETTHRHKKSRRAQKDSRSSSDSNGRGSVGSNRSSPKHERASPKYERSSSPDVGPSRPPDPDIGPPLPPPLGDSLAPPEKTEFRPTHEAFSSLGAMMAMECFQPTTNKGGGNGASAAASFRVLRCLVCGVDASGEATFIQHLCGRAHQKANQGRTGFAGLAPNSVGRIPPLVNHVLRAAAVSLGMDPDGSSGSGPAAGATATENEEPPPPPWAPPSRSVHIPAAVEEELKRALARTAVPSAPASLDRAPPPGDIRLIRLYQSKGVDQAKGVDDVGETAPIPNDILSRPHKAAVAMPSRAPPPPSAAGRRRALPPLPRVVAGGGPCAAVRQGLPVAQARDELLAALSEPACIVEGETGSGKTTQVPQFLLEEACERATPVNVIVTQPRRISAIGVADRVAAERGERAGNGAVGYAVRGESRQCAETCLLFCTTGVLLRMLEEDPHLATVTHVLVDEVSKRAPDAPTRYRHRNLPLVIYIRTLSPTISPPSPPPMLCVCAICRYTSAPSRVTS